MTDMMIKPIGKIEMQNGLFAIRLEPEYAAGLKALDGFSHLEVLWWFSQCDTPECRAALEIPKPYKKAPEVMGVFATRSPARPNPIALSTVEVVSIDHDNGVILVPYLDADPGTPVLDIKPYEPSIDRVESPRVPDWCAHWPKSYEASGRFDWEQEFLF